jgi:hypothetical protein
VRLMPGVHHSRNVAHRGLMVLGETCVNAVSIRPMIALRITADVGLRSVDAGMILPRWSVGPGFP